ncbi:DNA primase [Heyndrickxia coagulans]|uniref:DNA primase n=1 Tax=Heyndrickxia coagulans TaxID=1398 RepID=UPI002E1CEBE1|nr:DNA primase [Heyndrickxia coagulans]MED4965052.1 DNA primase [Heyndrickxia coagulans]
MTGMIPNEKIDEIRRSSDIVEVVSDYVQLKKQGRNYFGLCPFHGEHTPSFSVSPDKQIFHCFGCGAGGNVFTFLMDIEGISFQEAAEKLAQKAHIELGVVLRHEEQKNIDPKRRQMLEAHELLQKLYHHLLLHTKEGEPALKYLRGRGFTDEAIEKFGIGYALPAWDFATNMLQKRGFPLSVLEESGLVIRNEKDGKYFDRFRDRIMFPIMDEKGNMVAFAGRAVRKEEHPKYLNSPETPLFNKSKLLFNLNRARGPIRKKQQAVIFEGYADVISADRAGVENGIATMGTSITAEHVRMIKRLTDGVVICYDSDQAGFTAAFRAGKMLSENGCEVRVAQMPDGLDPDDYINRHGGEKFRRDVIGASLTFMAFKMQYFRMNKNLQNEGEKLAYIEEVIQEIAKLENPVEKDLYLRQLSEEFSLSLDALKEQERQYGSRETGNRKRSRPAGNPAHVHEEARMLPANMTAERRLLWHMLRDGEVAYKVKDFLGENSFYGDEHQAIFTYLLGWYEEGNPPDTSAFLSYLPDSKLQRIAAEIEMMTVGGELTDEELEDYVQYVLKHQKLLRIQEKLRAQKDAERQNDFQKALQLAGEIVALRKSMT